MVRSCFALTATIFIGVTSTAAFAAPMMSRAQAPPPGVVTPLNVLQERDSELPAAISDMETQELEDLPVDTELRLHRDPLHHDVKTWRLQDVRDSHNEVEAQLDYKGHPYLEESFFKHDYDGRRSSPDVTVISVPVSERYEELERRNEDDDEISACKSDAAQYVKYYNDLMKRTSLVVLRVDSLTQTAERFKQRADLAIKLGLTDTGDRLRQSAKELGKAARLEKDKLGNGAIVNQVASSYKNAAIALEVIASLLNKNKKPSHL